MVVVKPFLFVSLLLGIALVVGLYWLYQKRRARRSEEAYRNSTEGMIATRLEQCRTEIAANERELNAIYESIAALRKQLQGAPDELPRTRAETERLLASYEQERLLREKKIEFYRQCIARLQRMQRNHERTRTLEHEHAKLKQLQEKHYDGIADLESLRTSLEYEQRYLDTIDELAVRMLRTESPRDAQVVNRELDRMSRELDEDTP